MHRFCVAIILLLLPWPGSAAASEAVRDEEARFVQADAGYALEAARSPGGLGILTRLEKDSSESRPRSTPDHDPGAGGTFPLPHVLRIAGEAALPPAYLFSPHCERLPYHATAPPFPR